jgi:hypothetical protein
LPAWPFLLQEAVMSRFMPAAIALVFLASPALAVAKSPPHLNDAQRRVLLQSVSGKDTTDKLPERFTPAVGAKIPTQKKLPIHPVPPPARAKIPELKNYDYAKLSDKVLLIDPMTRKIVDVIPR